MRHRLWEQLDNKICELSRELLAIDINHAKLITTFRNIQKLSRDQADRVDLDAEIKKSEELTK